MVFALAMEKSIVLDIELPVLAVTLIVAVGVPAVIGIPEITPVVGSRLRPLGRPAADHT
jgi:hypothetical protein